MLNGKNWRSGFYNKDILPSTANAGLLRVDIENGVIKASYNTQEVRKQALDLHVALLGMNLQSDIKAGENAGKKAKHEFVVLQHNKKFSGNKQWQLKMPRPINVETNQYAIVAWISRADHPAPIQSTGGPLPSDYQF